MTPEIKFRFWSDRLKSLSPAVNMYGLMSSPVLRLLGDGDEDLEPLRFTGKQSIDGEEVYEGYYLCFPNDKTIYEVRWDDDEGAWGIFYKSINAFKIGMTQFMQIAGNKYEGVKSEKTA